MGIMLRTLYIGSLCLLLYCSGCQKTPTQSDVEWQTASRIVSLLKLSETLKPNATYTNLAELFAVTSKPYPYSWHHSFRRFGQNAGFENSIYEKYIFPPPGLHGRHLEGEILFLNAKPFVAPDGETKRMIVTKTGEGLSSFRITWRDEETIQKIFKEAGVTIPVAAKLPAPALSGSEEDNNVGESKLAKVRENILGFLHAKGMSGSAAWSVWVVLCSLPFIALAVSALMLWRRKGR